MFPSALPTGCLDGGLVARRIKLGGAPPKLTDIRVIKDPGAVGLKGDEYIHREMDFDWDSEQDVEIDVSPIPGVPLSHPGPLPPPFVHFLEV